MDRIAYREAKDNIAELINLVVYSGKQYIFTRDSYDIAVLLSSENWGEIQTILKQYENNEDIREAESAFDRIKNGAGVSLGKLEGVSFPSQVIVDPKVYQTLEKIPKEELDPVIQEISQLAAALSPEQSKLFRIDTTQYYRFPIEDYSMVCRIEEGAPLYIVKLALRKKIYADC